MGLEPTPTCVDRILSPARLPFRHFGVPGCPGGLFLHARSSKARVVTAPRFAGGEAFLKWLVPSKTSPTTRAVSGRGNADQLVIGPYVTAIIRGRG